MIMSRNDFNYLILQREEDDLATDFIWGMKETKMSEMWPEL